MSQKRWSAALFAIRAAAWAGFGLAGLGLHLGLTSAAAQSGAAKSDRSWVASARTFVPQGYVAGEAFRTDTGSMAGYLVLYRTGSDDPKHPGSVFEPRHVLVVKLARANGALKAVSGEFRPRAAEPNGTIDDDYDRLHRELAAKAQTLPAGTMACAFSAYSVDKDPKGLEMRAEPSVQSKVLGTLPPPYAFKSPGLDAPKGGWLTEFQVIGFKDGWFLIERARPPGQDYADEKNYPRNHPNPYAGRGWIAAEKTGAHFGNGATRIGGLYQSPHSDAKWSPARDRKGKPISSDGEPKRIFACSGHWALVESGNGVRGWWREMCSNQVSNCN